MSYKHCPSTDLEEFFSPSMKVLAEERKIYNFFNTTQLVG